MVLVVLDGFLLVVCIDRFKHLVAEASAVREFWFIRDVLSIGHGVDSGDPKVVREGRIEGCRFCHGERSEERSSSASGERRKTLREKVAGERSHDKEVSKDPGKLGKMVAERRFHVNGTEQKGPDLGDATGDWGG